MTLALNQKDFSQAELRRSAGRLLKEWRTASGLTQKDLAQEIGVEYYNFISAVEQGRCAIPDDKYEAWANALGKDKKEFARTIWAFYHPEMSKLII